MRRITLFVFLITLMAACSNSENKSASGEDTDNNKMTRIDSLKKEVMAIHDTTMKDMGEVSRLQKELKARQDTTNIDSTTVQTTLKRLQKSHDDMMNWMRQYKNVDNKQEWNKEDKVSYLTTQKDRVAELKDYMATTIQEAQSILDKEEKISEADTTLD